MKYASVFNDIFAWIIYCDFFFNKHDVTIDKYKITVVGFNLCIRKPNNDKCIFFAVIWEGKEQIIQFKFQSAKVARSTYNFDRSI